MLYPLVFDEAVVEDLSLGGDMLVLFWVHSPIICLVTHDLSWASRGSWLCMCLFGCFQCMVAPVSLTGAVQKAERNKAVQRLKLIL